MSISQHVEAQDLKPELEKLLQTLKNNRDKVPLQVLKSKYKTGYDALCKNIKVICLFMVSAASTSGMKTPSSADITIWRNWKPCKKYRDEPLF